MNFMCERCGGLLFQGIPTHTERNKKYHLHCWWRLEDNRKINHDKKFQLAKEKYNADKISKGDRNNDSVPPSGTKGSPRSS